MVKVYFENIEKTNCNLVATFASEDIYIICLLELEAEAKKRNLIVTETID